MSSSVISGFNSGVVSKVTASIEITNLHNDVYGEDMERPMQTTWSEYAAGGHQSRHVPLNISASGKSDVRKGLDDYTTRPEAWKILLGDCGTTTGSIGMVCSGLSVSRSERARHRTISNDSFSKSCVLSRLYGKNTLCVQEHPHAHRIDCARKLSTQL